MYMSPQIIRGSRIFFHFRTRCPDQAEMHMGGGETKDVYTVEDIIYRGYVRLILPRT